MPTFTTSTKLHVSNLFSTFCYPCWILSSPGLALPDCWWSWVLMFLCVEYGYYWFAFSLQTDYFHFGLTYELQVPSIFTWMECTLGGSYCSSFIPGIQLEHLSSSRIASTSVRNSPLLSFLLILSHLCRCFCFCFCLCLCLCLSILSSHLCACLFLCLRFCVSVSFSVPYFRLFPLFLACFSCLCLLFFCLCLFRVCVCVCVLQYAIPHLTQ